MYLPEILQVILGPSTKAVNKLKVKHCINETKLRQLIQFNLYININVCLIVFEITKYM